jgi:hypothetical protein
MYMDDGTSQIYYNKAQLANHDLLKILLCLFNSSVEAPLSEVSNNEKIRPLLISTYLHRDSARSGFCTEHYAES